MMRYYGVEASIASLEPNGMSSAAGRCFSPTVSGVNEALLDAKPLMDRLKHCPTKRSPMKASIILCHIHKTIGIGYSEDYL